MLLRTFFENLHAAMAILALFEEFPRKFCLNILTIILSASPNTMHFVRTFLIMRVRLVAIEEVRNCEKIVYICIKNIVENDWWEDAYPHPTPMNLPLAISIDIFSVTWHH